MFTCHHVSFHSLLTCCWLLEKITKKNQLKAIAVIVVDSAIKVAFLEPLKKEKEIERDERLEQLTLPPRLHVKPLIKLIAC